MRIKLYVTFWFKLSLNFLCFNAKCRIEFKNANWMLIVIVIYINILRKVFRIITAKMQNYSEKLFVALLKLIWLRAKINITFQSLAIKDCCKTNILTNSTNLMFKWIFCKKFPQCNNNWLACLPVLFVFVYTK